jgi:methionyl-tRNA formyltransferase
MVVRRKLAIADRDMQDPKRIVLFGMECAFTASFVESLLATPVAEIAAVVVPRTEATARAVECSWNSSTSSIENLTILELSGKSEMMSREFLSSLEALDSDLIVVACFPWRLPSSVFALPRIASVNVHPSRLPDGRGPEPIFWAFRRDLDTTGVTLHMIDDGLDTGPIIAQRSAPIPNGATMITLERALAHLAADMLSEFLNAPWHSVTPWPQPAGDRRSAPFPDAEDLIVTTAWNATAAARFINAASPVYRSIEVLVLANGQRLAVAEVLGIEENASTAPAVEIQGNEAWIRFPGGILRCRLRSLPQRLAFAI